MQKPVRIFTKGGGRPRPEEIASRENQECNGRVFDRLPQGWQKAEHELTFPPLSLAKDLFDPLKGRYGMRAVLCEEITSCATIQSD